MTGKDSAGNVLATDSVDIVEPAPPGGDAGTERAQRRRREPDPQPEPVEPEHRTRTATRRRVTMAYATVDEARPGGSASRRPRSTNRRWPSCLGAAAEEIDGEARPGRAATGPPPPVAVSRCNVNRAVEWFTAADAAFGAIGYSDIGQLRIPKTRRSPGTR